MGGRQQLRPLGVAAHRHPGALSLETQTVSLVLGSGGARGLAHVGAIRYLTEHGFDIRSISGCSIGAMIGGVYALGKLDEFAEWSEAITRIDILVLLDLSFRGEGIFKGDRIIDRLRGFVGDAAIEDLPVAYTAVAADIHKGREVWIDSGPLFDAIRASIAMPLFFTPFPYNGAKLFDGGLLNPVPVAPTVRDSTDLTIAVNLGGPPERRPPGASPPVEDTAERPDGRSAALHERIAAFIDDLKEGLPTRSAADLRMYDIAQSSFDAMQGTLARHQLAAYRPDVEIIIPRDTCRILEFYRAGELIDLGYELTARTMSRRR